MEKTQKNSLFNNENDFMVEKVVELNFFDLTGERAKNKGCSNKSYHAELQISKSNNTAQIYTLFGPTGCHQTADWRHYNDLSKARKEFESIIKSKVKKGYKEIDVAQRVYGSSAAKEITKPVELKNVDKTSVPASPLHIETQKLISGLMGSTNNFVIQTLKCPLGQLTNNQIDGGRNKLNEAKQILTINGSPNKKDLIKLQDLTNDFYGLIPHNLGSGARGKMEHLLFDDLNKVNQKEYDLDTLLDAKSIGAILTSNSVDAQYDSLKTDMKYIESKAKLFGWLNDMVQKTRASNHHYLKNIKLLNAWEINRAGEKEAFKENIKRISKECKKWNVPDVLWRLVKEREDVPEDFDDLYKKSNVVPLFHGTRSQNLCGGIFNKGLLIRPSNVVLCGSMYGDACYFACHSTKSINYTSISSSYWANGSDDKAYLLVADCCLGNQQIAQYSHRFTENNIKPNHSVWAKSGYSGIINDEFMLYNTKQHHLRYLLEFTCR